MTLYEECQMIQEYTDIQCSDNPEEVIERIQTLSSYLSQCCNKKGYRKTVNGYIFEYGIVNRLKKKNYVNNRTSCNKCI